MREIVKKFSTLPKKSITIAGIGIVGIIVLSAILISNMQPTKTNIALLKEEFVVEYGEPISTTAKEYIKADKDVLKETSIVVSDMKNEDDKDYPKVGTYKATATFEEEELTFKIVVKDTTAPVFVDFKETLEVEKDKENYDFVSQYKAEDLSKVEITVDTSKVNLYVVGEYEITVKAEDEYKNTTSKKATVKVTAPVVVEDTDNSVVDEQPQSSDYIDPYVPNTGTDNNTVVTPTPQQPKEDQTPTTCQFSSWQMVANSGYANYDYQTAWDWGENQMFDEKSKWYMHGYNVLSTKDNCGKEGWTISFY